MPEHGPVVRPGFRGPYEIEDFRARAARLDLLESDINLMSQDLERLMEEILLDEEHR